jgi:hypothetical protein
VGIGRSGKPERPPPLLVLAEIAAALTLVVIFIAVRRLDLYEQVFGLTMLRLYVKVACFWIAAVFVLFGVYLAGVAAPRDWSLPAAGAIGLTAVFALNLANPEGLVVRHNLAHARAGHAFDPSYVLELSDDAVPAVLAGLPDLAPADRAAVHSILCATDRKTPFTGWAALNLSRERASESRAAECDAR